MARTIEFDAQALIGRIDALRGAQLPYAGNQALWALKPKLRTVLQQEMRQRFRAPVPLTLNSPFMRIDGLEMTVSIKPDKVAKGSDPASYLYPVTAETGRGGGAREAFPTVATRKLRAMGLIGGSEFLVPYLGGRGVRTKNGRMVPQQYREALAGVLASDRMRTGWRYFISPDPRISKPGTGKQYKPGIYRVKGGDLQMLFGIAKTRTAPVIFPFGDFVEREARKILPSLLSKALDDALK